MQIIELTIILERSILPAIFTILRESSTIDFLRKPLCNRLLWTAETLIWYCKSPLLGGFTVHLFYSYISHKLVYTLTEINEWNKFRGTNGADGTNSWGPFCEKLHSDTLGARWTYPNYSYIQALPKTTKLLPHKTTSARWWTSMHWP